MTKVHQKLICVGKCKKNIKVLEEREKWGRWDGLWCVDRRGGGTNEVEK